jgi:hypothetical protein
VILVVLGSTTFDGVTRSQFWTDLRFEHGLTGWRLTAVNTIGLLGGIAVVTLAFWLATAIAARIAHRGDVLSLARAFVPSLVPIVLAYSLAHYFSLFVFESQSTLALASDPFGLGWDILGTSALTPDYTSISPATIAWVQAAAIVIGHVLGVMAAHDRAVELFPAKRALNSQLPLLGVMVVYTVGGLALLLGT